ncbi:MAG: hypothetical protein H6R19_300 [Proteobacteria bacterium]|nr:hypothetical protein [Pseudomonadota bacterium]
MSTQPFTRPTIVSAIEFLGKKLTQALFDQLLVRLELDNDISLGTGLSVTAKCAWLARTANQRATDVIGTLNGRVTLAEAVVREAVEATMPQNMIAEQQRFLRGLALDGYIVSWDSETGAPLLRAALPGEADLPATDDEVHQLLKQFAFTSSLSHFDQAVEAHTRGDWAAANSQVRTFLESLLDEIARRVYRDEASNLATNENRRALLANNGFLSKDRNEWTDDGKNYLNGLFKMLHTEGSHPGLSDEDHSTFRLHLALITGRTFLRRLKDRESK